MLEFPSRAKTQELETFQLQNLPIAESSLGAAEGRPPRQPKAVPQYHLIYDPRGSFCGKQILCGVGVWGEGGREGCA